jgi:hypothetical protein
MTSKSRRGSAAQPDPGRDDVADAEAQVCVTCAAVGQPASARVLFAVVDARGALARGLGAASSTRLAAGMYQVVFDQDVSSAAYVGTVGLTGGTGVAQPGGIAVAGRTGIQNAVFVQTYAGNGTPADRAFHLAVLA